MPFESVVVIVIGLSIAILALLVLHRNKKGHINQLFFFLALSMDIWLISAYISELDALIQYRLFLSKIAFVSVVAALAILYQFSLRFPYKIRTGQAIRILSVVSLVWAVALMALISATRLVIAGVESRPWGFDILYGDLYIGFLTFCLCWVVMVVGNFFIAYKRTSKREKKQLQYVAIGFTAYLAANVIFNLGLRFLLQTDQLYRFGNYSVIFFVGFTGYAIVKHQLMDVRAIVLKSVVYTILLGVVGGIFGGLLIFIKQDYETIINPDILLIITGLATAFGFQPLRRLIENSTDKIFAKGRYDFNKVLGKLGDVVARFADMDKLTTEVLQVLVDDMRITRAAFIVAGNTNIDVNTTDNKLLSKPRWVEVLNIAKQGKIISTDGMDDGSKEQELLKKLKTEILVPLVTDEGCVGAIALGEKRSGDMYSLRDVQLLEIIAPEIAVATQHAKLFKQKEMRINELDCLDRLSLSLGSTIDLDSILKIIVDEAVAATGAENGSLMLLDQNENTLSLRVTRGTGKKPFVSRTITIQEGVAGWVARHNEPMIIVNGKHDNPDIQKHLNRQDVSSSLTVPLVLKEKVIGVLSLNRKKNKEVFTEDNLRLVKSFAAHAAEALENARLYEDMETTFLGTIAALAKAVDARDKYTAGHSEEVTVFAVAMAKTMGLPEDEVRNIELAGRLHDIGKIGISDTILNKPDRLTEDEFEIIKQHPRIAVDILASVQMLKDTIPLILYHHERFDGTGYPIGLSGETIPLGARIIAVADSVNAITSERPYSKAECIEDAVAELKRCSGTQFDVQVVKAFLRVLENDKRDTEEKRQEATVAE